MNAPLKITPAPVRKSIRVNAPQAKAFETFTARIDAWWPRGHHVGASPLKKVIIEPFVGGRWYHLSENGSEGVTGIVRVWQPSSRVVLSWRLNAKFEYDDDMHSEVDVTFTPDGADATRVDLEHRITAVDADALRAAVDAPGGWTGILAAFAQSAES
ncbi:MAG TPA: SRPBCC family protein [Rhizomicrobium sp.]|nr:SRPBCC family protein [Rhizomicrobium sp.]